MATKTCPTCGGSGVKNPSIAKYVISNQCDTCGGTGQVQDYSKKVICTELIRQKKLSHALYISCQKYAKAHWSQETYNGYHLWAIPLVKIIRRHQWLVPVVHFFAYKRAKHVAYKIRETSELCLMGWFFTLVLDNGSQVLGYICGKQNYEELYTLKEQA